jgi:hypothetical protein
VADWPANFLIFSRRDVLELLIDVQEASIETLEATTALVIRERILR